MDGDRDLGRLWMDAMRSGDFAEAWTLSDAVLEERCRSGAWNRDQPLHVRPLWDGTPLAGRAVLVRCHHGLGDSIQFLRYVPRLAESARSVAVQAQAALLPLLASLAGGARLLPLDVPEPPHEVAIESMELPHAMRTTLATIPADIPYLSAGAARTARSRALRVGIAWRGGDWDPHRALPSEALAPFATLPGIALVNLQFGADSARAAAALGFAEPEPPDPCVLSTARRIAGLDLVIAIDSMVAHLAGALGAPVWLLLHARCDWRWMRARDDSPGTRPCGCSASAGRATGRRRSPGSPMRSGRIPVASRPEFCPAVRRNQAGAASARLRCAKRSQERGAALLAGGFRRKARSFTRSLRERDLR